MEIQSVLHLEADGDTDRPLVAFLRYGREFFSDQLQFWLQQRLHLAAITASTTREKIVSFRKYDYNEAVGHRAFAW